MKYSLHDYQNEAVDFICGQPSSALFLDCGLGKTLITLTAIDKLLKAKQTRGVLIVAPLRVARLTWPMEIQKWDNLSWMEYTILHGKKKELNLFEDKQVYLINYEGISWLAEALKGMKVEDWPFDTIVWDELTKMKTHSSMRFKVFKPLVHKFKRRIGLTGTPTPKGILDLYAQMYVVDAGKSLGTNFHKFKHIYFKPDFMGYNWEPLPFAEAKINELIAPNVLRMSSKEYLDLETPDFVDVELNLPAKNRADYKKLEKELFIKIDDAEIEAFNAAALTNKCLQFASGAVYDEEGNTHVIHDTKIEALKEILDTHDCPILVGYNFKHEAERIAKAFPEAEFLKSGISESAEQDILDRWNNKKIKLLACHPASAGHGLNLQKGTHILVWMTLNWSLELYIQLNKRVDRQGQTKRPIIYRFITLNTVDEVVAENLRSKNTNQNNILNALKLYKDSKK